MSVPTYVLLIERSNASLENINCLTSIYCIGNVWPRMQQQPSFPHNEGFEAKADHINGIFGQADCDFCIFVQSIVMSVSTPQ